MCKNLYLNVERSGTNMGKHILKSIQEYETKFENLCIH